MTGLNFLALVAAISLPLAGLIFEVPPKSRTGRVMVLCMGLAFGWLFGRIALNMWQQGAFL